MVRKLLFAPPLFALILALFSVPSHKGGTSNAWAAELHICAPASTSTVYCRDVEVTFGASGFQPGIKIYIAHLEFDYVACPGFDVDPDAQNGITVNEEGKIPDGTKAGDWNTGLEGDKTADIVLRFRVGQGQYLASSTPNTVTVDNCAGGKFYVWGLMGVSNLTGVKATITCREATLCNEEDQDPTTFTAALGAVTG